MDSVLPVLLLLRLSRLIGIVGHVFSAPVEHGVDDGQNGHAVLAHFVFDAGRVFIVDDAGNDMILLQLAELFGQYTVADILEQAEQFAETVRAFVP